MNITQPGVSRSIGLMERRIGYKLFERHGRRVTPTPEAEALYREIEPLYSSFDRIAELNRTSATNAPRLYLFGYPCASGCCWS